MIWTHKIAWDPKKAQESYTVGWLEWHGLPTTGHLAQGRSSMRPGGRPILSDPQFLPYLMVLKLLSPRFGRLGFRHDRGG